VHFAGLPPKGSYASLPATGTLVLSLREYGTKSFYEVDLNVYADGRMLWQKWDHSAYAGVVPDGANKVDTGFVERRLTSRGVRLLRSRILSTGLFEHRRLRLHAGRHARSTYACWKAIDGRRSRRRPNRTDRGGTLHQGNACPGPTLARVVDALLPNRQLGTGAWADPEVRAFVPSHYWFA
jgi:hypothetical protein